MKNAIKRICGYTIGYTCINSVIPEIGWKEFAMVTLGGCILIITAILFKYE